MEANPAFIRLICLAKRHELAGDMAAAVACLADALRLTGDAWLLMQVERWRKRLAAKLAARAGEKTKNQEKTEPGKN